MGPKDTREREHKIRLKDRDLALLTVSLGRYILELLEGDTAARDLETPLKLYGSLRRTLKWALPGRREEARYWWLRYPEERKRRREDILREISEIGTNFQIPGMGPKSEI